MNFPFLKRLVQFLVFLILLFVCIDGVLLRLT